MSKSLFAFTLSFVIGLSFIMCGCGRIENSDKDSSPNTVGSVANKSPERALQTIQSLLQKDVKVESNYLVGKPDDVRAIITSCPEEDDKLYNIWTLDTSIQEPYSVIFLYKEDKKAVMATSSDRDFIGSQYQIELDYRDEQYHDTMNYGSDGAFAWNFCTCASAILGKEQDFECSSIWTYNETESSVSLIWSDEELNIWKK